MIFKCHIQLGYFDVIAQCASLLGDRRLQDGFQTHATPKYDGEERVYTELATGAWWEATDRMTEKPEVSDMILQYHITIFCNMVFSM